MRNMSFALTTDQVRRQQKTVTRRTGWQGLKPGTLLQPVVKGMGLKKGERAEKIGGPIRVLTVRSEPLSMIAVRYDAMELSREGFPTMSSDEFVEMFCRSHRVTAQTQLGDPRYPHQTSRPCCSDDYVTRISFEYVNPPQPANGEK